MTLNALFNLTCDVRISHGLLADSVDASLASLLYSLSCKTDAVLSEVHDQ